MSGLRGGHANGQKHLAFQKLGRDPDTNMRSEIPMEIDLINARFGSLRPQRRPQTNTKQTHNKRPVCYYCSKVGHTRSQCYALKRANTMGQHVPQAPAWARKPPTNQHKQQPRHNTLRLSQQTNRPSRAFTDQYGRHIEPMVSHIQHSSQQVHAVQPTEQEYLDPPLEISHEGYTYSLKTSGQQPQSHLNL